MPAGGARAVLVDVGQRPGPRPVPVRAVDHARKPAVLSRSRSSPAHGQGDDLAGDADPNAPHIENTQQWDPANQTVTPLALPGWDLFCSGHAFLADGRLFVAGGHIQNGVGSPKAGIYNPSTNTWAAAPNMNAGRWYPTVTTLANGDALVVSGSLDSNYGGTPCRRSIRSGPTRGATSRARNSPWICTR